MGPRTYVLSNMYTCIAKQYVCKCSRAIKNRKQFMDTKKALLLMMMIAFNTIKSSFVPLIEGLCAKI